nr:MAG TPA: hypothetical protein [Caudoviricetes sp.]
MRPVPGRGHRRAADRAGVRERGRAETSLPGQAARARRRAPQAVPLPTARRRDDARSRADVLRRHRHGCCQAADGLCR